jgi:nucleoid-associated protein YgaU
MITAKGKPPCTYTVQSGDTLFDIAQAYYGDGNQYQRIVDANKDQNVTPATLQVGSTIQIPAVQAQGGVMPPTVMAGSTHTVRDGESLYGIAEACYGDCRQWRMISAANGNIRPEPLMAGQQLRLPVQQVDAPSPGSVAYPTTGHW